MAGPQERPEQLETDAAAQAAPSYRDRPALLFQALPSFSTQVEVRGLRLEIPAIILLLFLAGTPRPGCATYEDIHHRDETLTGIADPWILSRFGGSAGAEATI